jgi:hypothetical protein
MPIAAAKIDFHKARDFGDTLNISFQFIRQNFKAMMLGMLFIAGPFVLVGSVIPVMMFSRLSAPDSTNEGWLVNFGTSTLVNMLASIVGVIMAVGVIYEYILLYYHRDPGQPTIQTGEVWQAIRRDFWRISGATLGLSIFFGVAAFSIVMLAVLMGTAMGAEAVVFLVFASLAFIMYLFVPITLVVIITLHEGISFFDALPRAFYLVKGYWWQTFGLIAICMMIQYAVLIFCMVPFFIVGFSTEMFTDMGSSLESTVTYAIGFSLVLTLVMALSYCLFLTVSAFQYFSLVERKEAVGLLQKIESMGTDVPANARDFYADEEEHY